MKEFIEKLIERLEEIYNRNDKAKKEAYEEREWEYFDLFMHRNEGVYTSISIVNQLAEEHNNGWIACSERLPDVSGNYLTYVYYDDYENKYYSIEVDEIDCDGMVKEWNRTIGQIVAWQPLPAPYKEGK